MPGTIYGLLRAIEQKLKKYCPVTPPPGASWSTTRTLLEFLDYCLDSEECRLELKRLVEKFRHPFYVSKTPSDSIRALLISQSRSTQETRTEKSRVSKRIQLQVKE